MKQRELKFRAWDGQYMINPFCELKEGNRFWGEDLTNTPYNDPVAIMQYTGLKDKNGKEIYEGDILKGQRKQVNHSKTPHVFVEIIFQVKWSTEKTAFVIHYPKMKWDTQLGFRQDAPYEVIGNIYENPNLLTP